MKSSGGAFVRIRVACGCLLLLGFTSGAGLACTQIKENGISKALGTIGNWFSEIFSGEETSSGSSSHIEPFDPIVAIEPSWQKIFGATQIVLGAFPAGYEWIKTSDNQEFLITFLKNFYNFDFVKNVVFNFHLTVRAWLGIIFDSEFLLKLPNAFQTFKALSKFLSKEDSQSNGDKDMINWLYLRFIVNPRRTINVLRRGSKDGSEVNEQKLKCNGGKGKKKDNLPLGVCFICQGGKKLIDNMSKFLKEGTIPPVTPKKQE